MSFSTAIRVLFNGNSKALCAAGSFVNNNVTRNKRGRKGTKGFVFFPKQYMHEDPPFPLVNDLESGWTINSKRSGLLARKVGMTHVWNEWYQMFAVTILKVEDCQVVQVKKEEPDGYSALQLGAGKKKAKRTTKPMLKHFEKYGVEPKQQLVEFKVTPDALLPPGFKFDARHFKVGQLLDISGTTSGKGYQGVMKRWGFGGTYATHGVSLAHRRPGAIGACQDPGRVWKGKKMAGKMGNRKITMKNLFLWKVDPVNQLLYVKGAVPGRKNRILRVMDAKNKKLTEPPHFPAYITPEVETEETLKELVAPMKKPEELLSYEGGTEIFQNLEDPIEADDLADKFRLEAAEKDKNSKKGYIKYLRVVEEQRKKKTADAVRREKEREVQEKLDIISKFQGSDK